MSKEDKIQEQLHHLFNGKIKTFPAQVTAVNKDRKTVTIVDVYGIEYDDVRLSAIVADGDKIVSYPKQESWVLVSIINNEEDELYITAFSEVEEIGGKIEGTEYVINAQGFEINREGENLKVVFNDLITEFGKLCDALAEVVVSIGVTPNVPIINQIKQRATVAIKNRLNTILT